jgi:hypothetical protein
MKLQPEIAVRTTFSLCYNGGTMQYNSSSANNNNNDNDDPGIVGRSLAS